MSDLTRALGAAVLSCCLLLTTACGAAEQPDSAQPGQLSIVTAFYPLQFVTEQVAGDRAAVQNLTQPGAEPHDLELTPRQVASLIDADAVVYLKGFQPAVDEAVAQSGNDHILDTTSVVPLRRRPEERTDDHADDSPGEDSHDYGGLDPHVWLDPANMVTITDAVVDQLSGLDSDHAAEYRQNGQRLVDSLTSFDASYVAGLQSCERREFITTHAAFGYLAERYRLTQIGISGISPDAKPSPGRIAAVHEEAQTHGITTIFYETLVSPAVAKSIAGDLGLKTDVLDPVEGITADSRGDDYISVMRSNLEALAKANGCRQGQTPPGQG
ncbi:MAG: metal ABC transporter substrate-binding protein [Microlunatus sp.]|nr:metal ABC transporter substrate-binding protein [Microlunatus sp.]